MTSTNLAEAGLPARRRQPFNRVQPAWHRLLLEHDPEKCVAIFRKDHSDKVLSAMAIHPHPIAL